MKMNKKIYIAMLLAAFALNGAYAQDNTKLTKEITLEKDVAPIEKKAVKKNELPKVKKPTTTGTKNALGYSDLTTPIEVPASIPTLLPYGYRTATSAATSTSAPARKPTSGWTSVTASWTPRGRTWACGSTTTAPGTARTPARSSPSTRTAISRR